MMKKTVLSSVFLLFLFTAFGQLMTAETAPLPSELTSLANTLVVNHFPATVKASQDKDRKDFQYFWKHTTSVLSPNSDIEIVRCGAYIFYNQQWNLRVSYNRKDFARLFHCKKGKMKQGQPYTFSDNWRTDNRLLGGWALWYFIGKTTTGELVCGYEKIETVGEIHTSKTSKN